MHIRVFVLIKIPQRLNHSARFLGRGGAIEINQRMPVRLLAKDRKISAKGIPIQTLAGDLVHPLICYTCRQAPPYSKRATKPTCRERTCRGVCAKRRPLPSVLAAASTA